MQTLTRAITVILLICYAQAGSAQNLEQGVKPHTADKGPDHVDNIDIGKKTQLRTGPEALPDYGVVSVDGEKLYKEPRLGAETIEKDARFGESFALFEKTREGFFLGRSELDRRVGWIEASNLIIKHEAKRESQRNPAFIKVIVRNDWRAKGKGSIGYKVVEVRSGPGRGFDVRYKTNLFQIRYLYDIKRDEESGEKFLLIGLQPGFDPREPEAVLQGWIPKDAATLWTSRVAVYFDPHTRDLRNQMKQPVRIFQDEAAVKRFISSKGRDDSGVVTVEDFNFYESQEDKDIPISRSRFPVLYEREYSNLGPEYLKIAYVGDLFEVDTGIRPAAGASESVQMVERVLSEISHRDILFLIDATTSMGPYFEATGNAVRNFVARQSGQEEGGKYRYALAIYRDYEDGPGKSFRILSDFTPNAEGVMAEMKPTLAKSDQDDKDFPEALYQAIELAMTGDGLDWRDRSNAIVIIGDHGNHEGDMRFTLDKAVAAIKLRGAAVYAINIFARPGTERFNSAFQQQMKQLISQSGGKGELAVVDKNKSSSEASNSVLGRLEKFRLFSRETRNAVEDKVVKGKTLEEIERAYGTTVTKNALDFMRRAGLAEDVNLAELQQVVLEGWVPKNIPGAPEKRQLKPWVLITRYEVDELQGFLATLLKNLTRGKTQSVGDAVVRAVERLSGDERGVAFTKDEDVGQFLKRKFHLPFDEMNTQLNKTPNEIQNLYNTKPTWANDFRKHLKKKYLELQLVMSDTYAPELVWNAELNDYKPVKATTMKWFWKSRGQDFAWIPIEYIP